jgi:hypothetical protein
MHVAKPVEPAELRERKKIIHIVFSSRFWSRGWHG